MIVAMLVCFLSLVLLFCDLRHDHLTRRRCSKAFGLLQADAPTFLLFLGEELAAALVGVEYGHELSLLLIVVVSAQQVALSLPRHCSVLPSRLLNRRALVVRVEVLHLFLLLRFLLEAIVFGIARASWVRGCRSSVDIHVIDAICSDLARVRIAQSV